MNEGDTVVLTKDSLHYRAGATLTIIEMEDDRARVGICFTDGGEWVNVTDLEKIVR